MCGRRGALHPLLPSLHRLSGVYSALPVWPRNKPQRTRTTFTLLSLSLAVPSPPFSGSCNFSPRHIFPRQVGFASCVPPLQNLSLVLYFPLLVTRKELCLLNVAEVMWFSPISALRFRFYFMQGIFFFRSSRLSHTDELEFNAYCTLCFDSSAVWYFVLFYDLSVTIIVFEHFTYTDP